MAIHIIISIDGFLCHAINYPRVKKTLPTHLSSEQVATPHIQAYYSTNIQTNIIIPFFHCIPYKETKQSCIPFC